MFNVGVKSTPCDPPPPSGFYLLFLSIFSIAGLDLIHNTWTVTDLSFPIYQFF